MGNQDTPVLLLVDDSPAIHRLLVARLRDENLEFLAALSGEEGLEIAQAQQPSLVLLDLKMPDLSGFEVLKKLKADTRTMEIPVIVLSGSTTPQDKVVAFELGAMDFVCKPFDASELKARIHSALRIMRLMHLLEQRAQVDGLTGLWNRAHFNERLESELNLVKRSGRPLSLVMCDLDHFKKLNDTFGHPAGDAVLESFAKILNEVIRTCDVACRYGGEEFALILPDTPPDQGLVVCERIRRSIESHRWRRFPEIRAAASFGLAGAGADGLMEPSSWIEAADRSLYSAKQAGRNRTHVYDERLGTGLAPTALRMAG